MTRQATFLAVAIAISMGMSSSLTNAKGRLDHFGPATIEGPSMMGPGKWRSKIQLIFDPTSRQLVRRRYEVWDPQPHLKLDFHWQPAETNTHTPGRVNGRGHLIWRKPGQPSYDRTAIVSEYQGSMRDGRPHGHGRYLERNGLYYEGGWQHGRMHGSGSLTLANGDTYDGAFARGKAHGAGRYIDITGEIYEGSFANGRKHGRGRTTLPNGHSFTSEWADGHETPGSQRTRYVQRGTVFAGRDSDVRLGLTIDRRLPRLGRDDARRNDIRPGERDLWYAAYNRREGIIIQPASRRFMSVWKGNGSINVLPAEDSIYMDNFGVFSLGRGQLVPLEFVLHVQNRSSRPLFLTGGYLEVERSELETQPALQTSKTSAFMNSRGEFPVLRYGFFIENFGWGPAENLKVTYGYRNPDRGNRQSALKETKTIGTLTRSSSVSIKQGLIRDGISPRILGKSWRCQTANTPQACLGEARRLGLFGRLANYVTVRGGNIHVGVYGNVTYRWRTAEGVWRRRKSPFAHDFLVGYIENFIAEEGEGGKRAVITKKELRLRVGSNNYRLPFSFRKRVRPGTTRLLMRVGARQASQHRFRIVLQTSSGRLIRSRPIRLTYFWPRWIRKSAEF